MKLNILKSGIFFIFAFTLLIFNACEEDEITKPEEEMIRRKGIVA